MTEPAKVDGLVRSGFALNAGRLLEQYTGLTRDMHPSQRYEATLTLYSVGAVTAGTDAQARVTVRLEEGGKMVDGQGSDTDTIVASVRAYVHALNKLLVKRDRTEPVSLSA